MIINGTDYVWANDLSVKFLNEGYLLPGETIDDRVNRIVEEAEKILNIPFFAAKFKENLAKGWYSLSTPIWANFGTERGLPISCFSSHITDDMDSILHTVAEVGMMTKHGGGTAAYFGELRPRGTTIRNNGTSSGAVHFMQMFDRVMGIVSQGNTRRGNFAAYLPIDHKDIEEFLAIRSEGHPIQDISYGVCISDDWMHSMINGDIEKRNIWAKVIESRINKGYPYILWSDTVNRNGPQVYKDLGLKITHSNLCSEILLHTSAEESFVCDLSSMNISKFDEWKDTDAVKVLVYFLDAVMTEFIRKAEEIRFMERAVLFAKRQRALGIGWIGYHTYLQNKMVPFESMEAKQLNAEIAQNIFDASQQASKELAVRYGEPAMLMGYGLRNVTTCAVAPTKSSAFILGQVSEGIEPRHTNYEIKDLAKGKFSIRNRELELLLESKDQNTEEVWFSILQKGGSCQHLEFLSETEKEVFKTFGEISQNEIVVQAAQRQKWIDQGQSLNLMIHPSTPVKEIHQLLINAWRLGIKTLYYQKSTNAAQELARNLLECKSCAS